MNRRDGSDRPVSDKQPLNARKTVRPELKLDWSSIILEF